MNSLKFQDRLLGLQDNLLNFAYMLTANREEAKDLLQDTTLKALDNEDKYIDNVNFKGWVFTIMRNIFINNYRRVVRIIRKTKCSSVLKQNVLFYKTKRTSVNLFSYLNWHKKAPKKYVFFRCFLLLSLLAISPKITNFK